MRNMGYINISREKVKALLTSAPARVHEKELAARAGMSFPTYWRRFMGKKWREETTRNLAAILSEIVGREIRIEELIDG